MTNKNGPERLLFTFRLNGNSDSKRLVEITVEPLEQHEGPAAAGRPSWFGAEPDVASLMEGLKFAEGDIEGVVSALHTNRVATRKAEVLPSNLTEAGFMASV